MTPSERIAQGQKLSQQAVASAGRDHPQLAMSQDEPSGPDLDGVVADANAVGLSYVVIGGFSVIANGFVRATKDSDLLVPDGAEADEAILRFLDRAEATRLHDGKVLTAEDVAGAHHLRVMSRHGHHRHHARTACRRSTTRLSPGAPSTTEVGSESASVAGLRSIVGFKRSPVVAQGSPRS